MTIAIISDIHANLPAFEKVLESIDQLKPDTVYCLGDLVGYNVWPNEVIEKIRANRIPTIAGNHDAKVQKLSTAQMEEDGKNFGYRIIDEPGREFLAGLPAHIRIEFQFANRPIKLLFVHGSPESNEEYLLEDKDENEFLDVFSNADCDILCFGHSHKPYHRIMQDRRAGTLRFRHAINVGSVGKPKDNDPRACYVLLESSGNENHTAADGIQVKFVRVEYDVEKAAEGVENSPLPREFAGMLRKGF